MTPTEVYGQKDVKKPRLYVFKNMKEMIFELESCNWDNEDKDNHLLDCLKYIVNDNPAKTWTSDERRRRDSEDARRRQQMNQVTGY
jgi:hypothetical protein